MAPFSQTMTAPKCTPLAAVGSGLVAGVIGTVAMTGWQELSSRMRAAGEESAEGGGGQEPQDPWEQASAPAKVARRVIEGLFEGEAPPEWIPALTHGTHWAYGTAWGAA